jgi:hypothetical protein
VSDSQPPPQRRLRAGFFAIALILAACSSTPEELATDSVPATSTSSSHAVTTETTTRPADETPSQTPAEASRDGVIPELAALPYSLRVETRSEVPTDEGTWIVAVPTPELTELASENGCGFGNLEVRAPQSGFQPGTSPPAQSK